MINLKQVIAHSNPLGLGAQREEDVLLEVEDEENAISISIQPAWCANLKLISVRPADSHPYNWCCVLLVTGRYDREKCTWRYILDSQLICAMAPPGGARAVISSRTQSRFNLLNLTVPDDSQVNRLPVIRRARDPFPIPTGKMFYRKWRALRNHSSSQTSMLRIIYHA